jgi:hypothetical protein
MVIVPPDISTTTVHEHKYEYELKYKCRLCGCYRPRCCFRSHLDSYHLIPPSVLKDDSLVDSLFSREDMLYNK